MPRCDWCGTDPLYVNYHDFEWGVPEYCSRALWEKLVLDGFQAGLSWLTILKKSRQILYLTKELCHRDCHCRHHPDNCGHHCHLHPRFQAQEEEPQHYRIKYLQWSLHKHCLFSQQLKQEELTQLYTNTAYSYSSLSRRILLNPIPTLPILIAA
jgi:hypothetical protein